MAYKDGKGNLYPEPGDMLRHKGTGIVGRYISDVTANRGRRHLYVETAEGKRYCLPANEWEECEDEQIQ